jgi:carbon monoxide dehydrogenase subunit G
MKLEFSGAPVIDAPRKAVWQRLMDPNFIAASAPGVETVEAVDPTHFNVISGLGIGPMRLQFRLDVELSDIVEEERLRMVALGRGPGSEVDVVSRVRLEDAGAGRTRLDWAATCSVGGVLAGLGARMLEGTARRLTEDFWSDFARRAGAG